MRSPRLVIYLVILAAALMSGLASQYFFPGHLLSPVHLAFSLLGAILGFAWYRIDSDQHAYPRSAMLNTCVVFLSFIAMPYYFFRTRGFVKGLGATGAFIGTVVLWGLLQVSGEYLTYHLLQA
jgi:hypothetical protein